MFRKIDKWNIRLRNAMIAKCPNPQKENEKQRKQVSFNENGNCACNNSENNNDQKIYASMVCMSGND